MEMKLICACLLTVALLGYLADAQHGGGSKPQFPQPQWPQPPQPQRPEQPKKPQQPEQPQPQWPQPPQPQRPEQPKKPQQPEQPRPQWPQPPQPQWPQLPQPQRPEQPKKPQQPEQPRPQWPQPPQPQRPEQPKKPQQPEQPRPQWPQLPQPQRPEQPKKPQQPEQPQPQWPQPPQPQRPEQPEQPRPQWPQPPQPQRPQPQPQEPYRPPTKPQQPQPQKATPPLELFHSCEVAEQYKIHCGAPSISAEECEAINCCFDGRTCYYGKSVTLQCTKDGQFIVVVARDATLPSLDLETITFLGNEPGCRTVDTSSAFAIYQFHVTTCGTIMMEEPGVVIYQNRMSSSFEVAIADRGAITRDSSYELIVQCRYIGTSVHALVIEVGLVPPPYPVAAPGPLRVALRLGNGQCLNKGCVEEDVAYSSYYLDSDYPVTKVLRDPVYVEVRMLERTDPNLVLTLGRCWATSTAYPYSNPQWDLLIEGCPYRDDRYLTSLVPVAVSPDVPFPSHYRRFVFKMFTFVATGASDPSKKSPEDATLTPFKELVYIHCNAAVCQPSLGNNCEPRCYRKRRDIAASFLTSSRQEGATVTSPPIYFTNTQ